MTTETDNDLTLVFASTIMTGRSANQMDVEQDFVCNATVNGLTAMRCLHHQRGSDMYHGQVHATNDIEGLDYYHGTNWGETGHFTRCTVPLEDQYQGADEAYLYIYSDELKDESPESYVEDMNISLNASEEERELTNEQSELGELFG